jgi:hypothetical protein
MPRYNPPPNWPAPPPGWTPPQGWKAPANWPSPPKGWKFWLPDENDGSWFGRDKVLTGVGGGLAALLLIGTIASGGDNPVPNATGTPSFAVPTATPNSKPRPSPQPSPSLVTVPAVEGFTLAKAKRELRAADLEVGKVDSRPSSKKTGTVLKQGVAEGREVKPGSSVPLVVAAPLPRVPSVVGQSEASAASDLKDAGFKVKKTTQTRTTGRDGVVLSQSPPGGTRAKPKSVVSIVILNVQPAPDKPEANNCTPGYSPCLPPASDYDCAGGSGNGPKYTGPVRVTGSDPYDLDRDGDGTGCDE